MTGFGGQSFVLEAAESIAADGRTGTNMLVRGLGC